MGRDWAGLVDEHRNSQESVKEFCESRGIHPNTFYKKRKLLQQRRLVEIPVAPSSVEDIPIVVRTGRYRVSIRRGFDRECLRSVLEVIGEPRC